MEPSSEEPMEVDDSAKSSRAARSATVENLPWVEKYRPSVLEDLISHNDIISTISRLIDENKLPHLLFYGPPGTGKTSTILAAARKIYGKNFQNMILSLNASDERGIETVRRQIKDFANTRNIFSSGVKLIILDEADAMTADAQAALRRVIEKFTRTTRFCIICNYLNKIIPALQSRCTRFRFSPLKDDDVRERLGHIIRTESVPIDEGGLGAVVALGQGDMRKCLNILQSTFMAYPEVNEENVYACTGNPMPRDIKQIVDWLYNADFATGFSNIIKLQQLKGLALADIVTQIHAYVIRLECPPEIRMFLFDRLADLEHRLSGGASEKLNIGSLVGTFHLAKEKMFAIKDAKA